MATQPAAAPARVPKVSFSVIRIVARWLLRTIAAIVCVLVMYVASHTVPAAKLAVTQNTPSLPGSSISAYVAEPDYTQDYVPEKQSDGEFAQIKVGRLALYYEMMMLFTGLVIGIGAIVRRVQVREDKLRPYLEPKTKC